MINLLGKKVKPLVRRDKISASYASSVLHGSTDMHRSCHMTSKQVDGMVEKAIKELRKENREQEWVVNSVDQYGKFELVSDLGYVQSEVDRKDFRILSK